MTDFLDSDSIYVDIQPSQVDVGPYTDAGSIYVDVQPSQTDAASFIDAASVYLDIGISALEGLHHVDSGTIGLLLGVHGGECFSTYSGLYLGEGEAAKRWSGGNDNGRWFDYDSEISRWSNGFVIVEGINC